jgi:hypothetical protein
MDTDFLDWALADFSGYVAADELYDGPFCILSAVDNRRYKRILSDVLNHDPTHEDIRVFLRRLKTASVVRGLALCGVTTDGSALYPEPLREVFGKVRHQICQFHVIKDIVKAVVGAAASARKGLAARQPKLPTGRPSMSAAKAAARTKKRLAAQGAALFTHRYLFVQRPPEQNRTQDPVARQPWIAPVTRATSSHGPSVCVIRSALSDPDRAGQAGHPAASAPAVPPGE